MTEVDQSSRIYPMVARRLDGIEAELREVRGFLGQLVRVEERSNADRAELARLNADLIRLWGELTAVKDRSRRDGWTVGAIERVFWLLLAGAVAWVSRG